MGLLNGKLVSCPQRAMRLMSLKVDGTGTASVFGTCASNVTLTDNGTGDYTITFKIPFLRAPECVATPITDNIYCKIFAVAVGSVQVKTENLSGAATDADFHLMIFGSDTADQQ